jgi:hypothetical protein
MKKILDFIFFSHDVNLCVYFQEDLVVLTCLNGLDWICIASEESKPEKQGKDFIIKQGKDLIESIFLGF